MSPAAALRTFVESQPRYSTFVPLLEHTPSLHGDVVACVFLNSASSKTATANAEALPRMMQVHYAVAHADDADAKATTLAGWRLEKRTPVPSDVPSMPGYTTVVLVDPTTDEVCAQARCVRTESIAGAPEAGEKENLVVHVIDRPLVPTRELARSALGSADADAGAVTGADALARSAGASSAASSSSSATGSSSSDVREPSLADVLCPVLTNSAAHRAPLRDTLGALRANGSAVFANCCESHALASALGVRMLMLEAKAKRTQPSTIFAPLDARDGSVDTEQLALLSATAGRYILPVGRRIDVAAVRSHFRAGGAKIDLGPAAQRPHRIVIDAIDPETDELVFEGGARLVSETPAIAAAGMIYQLTSVLSSAVVSSEPQPDKV